MNERIAAFLAESVGECPYCGRPVRRDAPRGVDHAQRIAHLGCLDGGDDGPCLQCGQPVGRREQREEIPGRGLLHKACQDAYAKVRGR